MTRSASPRSLRLLAGVAFLGAQIGITCYYHFGPRRYFAWAPNDYLVTYAVDVRVHGRRLTPAEVEHRYRIAPNLQLSTAEKKERGFAIDSRYYFEAPAQHLIDAIRQYEQTYGARDSARVRFSYQLNDHRVKQWRWP